VGFGTFRPDLGGDPDGRGRALFRAAGRAWSDNQPDYHWMWPHEVKTTSDYWYPVRDTRGYRNATKDFAVNTDLRDGLAFGAVYSTAAVRNHRIVLRNARSGSVLFEATADIAPDRPFTREVKAGGDTGIYDLHLAVYGPTANSESNSSSNRPREWICPGAEGPGDPAKMSQDELFRAGEWLDKFVRTEDALPYYREALKKDPKDLRVNTEMGFLALSRASGSRPSATWTLRSNGTTTIRGSTSAGSGLLGAPEVQGSLRQFSTAPHTPTTTSPPPI